jgi:hypothetical protein
MVNLLIYYLLRKWYLGLASPLDCHPRGQITFLGVAFELAQAHLRRFTFNVFVEHFWQRTLALNQFVVNWSQLMVAFCWLLIVNVCCGCVLKFLDRVKKILLLVVDVVELVRHDLAKQLRLLDVRFEESRCLNWTQTKPRVAFLSVASSAHKISATLFSIRLKNQFVVYRAYILLYYCNCPVQCFNQLAITRHVLQTNIQTPFVCLKW